MDYTVEDTVCGCLQPSNRYRQKATEPPIFKTLSFDIGGLPWIRLPTTNLWYFQQSDAQTDIGTENIGVVFD
jgi:hypothetical protein